MVRAQEPTGHNQLGFRHCGVPSIRRSDRDVACFGKTILKNIDINCRVVKQGARQMGGVLREWQLRRTSPRERFTAPFCF